MTRRGALHYVNAMRRDATTVTRRIALGPTWPTPDATSQATTDETPQAIRGNEAARQTPCRINSGPANKLPKTN